eukprot:scaffold46075_cov61-Phaeocystis_antarctica.AAC.2
MALVVFIDFFTELKAHGSRPGTHLSPQSPEGVSKRESEHQAPSVSSCRLRSRAASDARSKDGNLLKGPWAGPKPHAAASLRPPGSHLVRVAGWHLELPVGGQGRDEDCTASGRSPMSG